MSGPPSPGAVRVLGRYALHDEIASGGMATVHLGRLLGPSGFSRTVAIKRLHVHLAKDPEFVSMLLDEARIVGRVRHLNVVPTLDVVSSENEVFLVMEYVQGETLARLSRASLGRGGALPVAVAVAIVEGVLHGLHAAHEARTEDDQPLDIVHRDVSPQNVLVGVDGVARLLDFGVAKAQGRIQSTREGQLKGKLGYMSPEQIQGLPTRATDIYAASVVLWETLTGKRLFDGENEAAILAKVLTATIDPPSKHAPLVSAELSALVLRGLDRDPAKRFPTARDMARALARVGPVAPASAVGEVVESLAAAKLAERAGRVAEVESTSMNLRALAPVVSDVPGDAATPAAPTSARHGLEPSSRRAAFALPPAASRRRVLPLAVGVAFLALTALWVLTRSERRAVTMETRPLAAFSTAAARAPAPSSSAPAPPAPDLSATTTIPERRLPSPPRGRCQPPYTIDSSGFKHYKRDCLK